jgi:outer membrane protein OmpA-like peptidoglycan-associated protein
VQPDEPPPDAAADSASATIEPAAGSVESPATDLIDESPAPGQDVEVPLEAAGVARIAPTGSAAAPAERAAPDEAVSVADQAAQHLPMAILFAADEATVTQRDMAKLEGLARARSDTLQLFVVGNGPRPGLAMERARSVAALLVGAGMPAESLIIEMGGESNVVVVYEPDDTTG